MPAKYVMKIYSKRKSISPGITKVAVLDGVMYKRNKN